MIARTKTSRNACAVATNTTTKIANVFLVTPSNASIHCNIWIPINVNAFVMKCVYARGVKFGVTPIVDASALHEIVPDVRNGFLNSAIAAANICCTIRSKNLEKGAGAVV